MIYYSSLMTHVRRHLGNLVLTTVFGGVIAFLALITLPDAHSVQTDYLIMQKTATSQDFYTLSKSAEYSGNVLKEAVLSNLFLQEVAQVHSFGPGMFEGDERKQLKEWRDMVSVKQRTSSGILEVTILHDNRSQAVALSQAVSDVLINKNTLFRSGNAEDLSIKLISGPIVEQNPSVTELLAGVIVGMIFAGSLFVLWVWYRDSIDHTNYSTFESMVGHYTDDSPRPKAVYEDHLPNPIR